MLCRVGYKDARVTFEQREENVDGADVHTLSAIDHTGYIPPSIWPDLYDRAGELIYRASLRPYLQDMARRDAAGRSGR